LASLLFLLATEADAGVLLQASEIMRIILDTDMMGDHGPMNTGFADEAEGIPPSGGHNPPHDQHPNPTGSGNTASSEQNNFLSIFYEHYIQWLAAPFQYTILHPLLRIPKSFFIGEKKSSLVETMERKWEQGACNEEPLLYKVPSSALRSSFAVELLSFCVRAHVYRMKFYLLRSNVLGNVLRLLKPSSLPRNTSGDRCLKLAALRFLRAILSVNDDFYHRHIIQHDLFGPVFEAFRSNPVGDNLVSSSIVEMCDFINTENIISLIEYIVTRHLSSSGSDAPLPSLEDVSSPYVSTLTCLRQAYEKLLHEKNNRHQHQGRDQKSEGDSESGGEAHSRYFHDGAVGRKRVVMNEKALEDQRKYMSADREESYFDADDDDEGPPLPPVVDEVDAQVETDNELHRTSRMFSLNQAPLLNNAHLCDFDENDENNPSERFANRDDGNPSGTEN
jgi:protein phosphatase-4 regulatory subunit 3